MISVNQNEAVSSVGTHALGVPLVHLIWGRRRMADGRRVCNAAFLFFQPFTGEILGVLLSGILFRLFPKGGFGCVDLVF